MNDITNKDIENKYTYFMDNASIHYTKEFKNLSKKPFKCIIQCTL
jgi:hypothetical protein